MLPGLDLGSGWRKEGLMGGRRRSSPDDWQLVPPLCREDNLEFKNRKKDAEASNAAGAADQHDDFVPDWTE